MVHLREKTVGSQNRARLGKFIDLMAPAEARRLACVYPYANVIHYFKPSLRSDLCMPGSDSFDLCTLGSNGFVGISKEPKDEACEERTWVSLVSMTPSATPTASIQLFDDPQTLCATVA